jgi:transcriptional regulator
MYTPTPNEETRVEVMHALVRAHPLGTWTLLAADDLLTNHVPFLLDAERGPFGTLVGHVARANPVWRSPPSAVRSVVSFQGPQAYVTPSWYASKREHGKTVPTWNYAVVHARGVPSFIEDRDWLLAHVSSLTDVHEAAEAAPWAVTDAPAEYTERMLGAIVGVEIPIERLMGKWKTSQNRPHADKEGVVAGLEGRGDAASAALVALHTSTPTDR